MKRFAIFSIAVAFGFLAGCASSSPALYQSVVSVDAGVQTTTTLVQSGTIPAATATKILNGAETTEAALKVWQAEIADGGFSATDPAPANVVSALDAFLNSLQAATTSPATQASIAKAKFTLKAGSVSPSDIISIVNIAVAVLPELETWITDVFNANTVTPAQITTEFSDLDASQAALTLAIQTAPPLATVKK